MAAVKKYLYGPVPSRRLGRSLGVDIVPGPDFAGRGVKAGPAKICSLDCIYCQLGRTAEKTIERKDYTAVEPILAELKESLAAGLNADFITISACGEPTLNSRLGEIIDGIKKITDIPVAVLTNGTLFYRQDVRADCAKADVVLPSLDAGDEQTFRRINRPHSDISVEKLISGLCEFRKEFSGRIWLEVFLVDGVNTDAAQIAGIKDAVAQIRPDRVQLNTAVRPTSEPGLERLGAEKLQVIAKQLGAGCEVVADFSLEGESKFAAGQAESVLSMLKHRPCSLDDICSGLGLSRNEAVKYISHFQNQGVIDSEEKDGIIFFKTLY